MSALCAVFAPLRSARLAGDRRSGYRSHGHFATANSLMASSSSPSSPPPPSDVTIRDVAARGARIRFVEAGSGPPLLLLHDFLSSHVAWDDVVPELAAHFRVIVPDLPGFGESEKPPPGRYA